jgi:dGTPase
MFAEVYLGPAARAEHAKAEGVVRVLVDHYAAHPEALPDEGRASGADDLQRVVDHVAGMTDRYAVRAFEALRVPRAFAA